MTESQYQASEALIDKFYCEELALYVCANHRIKMGQWSEIIKLDDVLTPLDNLHVENEIWFNDEIKWQYYMQRYNNDIECPSYITELVQMKSWDFNFLHGDDFGTNYFHGPFDLWFGLNRTCFFTDIPLCTYTDWYMEKEETVNNWTLLIKKMVTALGGDTAVYVPNVSWIPNRRSTRSEFTDWLRDISKTLPPDGKVFYDFTRARKYFGREENRTVPPITICRF